MPNELLISKKDLYGDLLINSAPHKYDERFKFTGKERDWETGYDFFGARYYFHLAGIWTGVDPLAHKYPWVTPYIYCGGNPIKYIDPDGRYFTISGDCEFKSRVLNLLSYLSEKSKSLSCLISSLSKNTNINIHVQCSTDAVEFGEIKPSETKGLTKSIEGSNVINIYLPNAESGENASYDFFVENDFVTVNSIAAHELGHVENIVNGSYVKDADYNKASQGDPTAIKNCNENEKNSIAYENEIREIEHCERRSSKYYKED